MYFYFMCLHYILFCELTPNYKTYGFPLYEISVEFCSSSIILLPDMGRDKQQLKKGGEEDKRCVQCCGCGCLFR